jgi:6-pyruvoyltetrahydropterin/6-carboxytetrahydropterin synthase
MGHCLPDHEGGCYRPHGHRYRFEVTLAGAVDFDRPGDPENGMLVDFGRLKEVVARQVIDVFDHRFVMSRHDPRATAMQQVFNRNDDHGGPGVILLDAPPTAEFLATTIAQLLVRDYPELSTVRVWETPTCSATWTH